MLGTALGTAAALALPASPARAGAPVPAGGGCGRRRIPRSGIGMHLYTMRTALAADFAGTLARLAEIGYATVGVSGRHGHGAEAIRRMLDAAGLRAVLEHIGYDTLRGPALPQALADLRTLGARWPVVPSLPRAMHTPAGFREAAREFNRIGAASRAAGLGPLLFHNHGSDHEVVAGELLYDILLAETDPELVGFELDLYWAVKGRADPRTLFLRHPGRFPALHVKDMAPDGDIADVGSGVLDFPSMFATAADGGVRQWLVEHDRPADPFATALTSHRYLAALRY
ncbi:sugar phosphate isomerase [Streptomyces clavuligerus]|uniref:Sugar phosphate isomerase / epimerase n=1 Tax=Streptomyces clavuligerus TaxID=1901 RepID=E2PZ71_STRCL|nr:sugar phosphate isomerase [Streptomyces clavuligerus]AXU11741.1 sugar phosphate isomerase/epimerase [Streptomyces clavuligerus]EFG10332.1 Sugar phosphate isomerase / epimerase [Streptomyces clavuligerus]QCS04522.1 sugar phosphate isomerase/epimerase [Streptomyces clavuligerus]QPJ96905.1 TIM barrel protein [Streptomyces clavuligerus]